MNFLGNLLWIIFGGLVVACTLAFRQRYLILELVKYGKTRIYKGE